MYIESVAVTLALLFPITLCRPPPEDTAASTAPGGITLLGSVVQKAVLPPRNAKGSAPASSKTFKELQLNLCNSGLAKSCYADGRSIPEASSLIKTLAPNTVTLNEICFKDVGSALHPALAEAWPRDYTYSVFVPALDKRTGGPYKCKNGDSFGNAIMGRVPAAAWSDVTAYGGKYASQDAGSNEQRTFACVHAHDDHFACSTHLTSTGAGVALAQCKALMFDALPYLKKRAGISGRTIVGGDFNLKYVKDGEGDAQDCVPNGYARKGDGDVQHIVYSNDFRFEDSWEHLLGNTDHNGWEVKLSRS